MKPRGVQSCPKCKDGMVKKQIRELVFCDFCGFEFKKDIKIEFLKKGTLRKWKN